MRMLFLVDDDITDEELLKKASEHFETYPTNREVLVATLNSSQRGVDQHKMVSGSRNTVEIKTGIMKKIKQGCEMKTKGRNTRLPTKRKRTCSESLKAELKKNNNNNNAKEVLSKSCISSVSEKVNVLTDSCSAKEVQVSYSAASSNDVAGANKPLSVPRFIQHITSTRKEKLLKAGCKSLNADTGRRKRKAKSQPTARDEKKAKHSESNTGIFDFSGGSNQVEPVADQQNRVTTGGCAKIERNSLEDSCLSGDSELSESRRSIDNYLTEEKNCTLVFENLFSNESDQDKTGSSPKLKSSSPTCQSSPGIKDLNLPDWMYVALDCEMVGIGPKGKQSVLARCSIVDYSGSVLYDSYIKPAEVITDYRTRWSGIRSYHMASAEPVQQALPRIQQILKNKVIIGHAVYNDFSVLGLKPEHYMVRDTAQCRALVQMSGLEGRGNSLKKLCHNLLNRVIQVGRNGHCSVEDARATLDLFKLVRKDWELELSVKWMKKDPEIPRKLSELVEKCADSHRHEDFLQDKFWPVNVID